MSRRSSRTTRLYAPRTRGRTRTRASTVSRAGSSASRAVRSSVSVLAGSRPRPGQARQELARVDEVAVVADRQGPPRCRSRRHPAARAGDRGPDEEKRTAGGDVQPTLRATLFIKPAKSPTSSSASTSLTTRSIASAVMTPFALWQNLPTSSSVVMRVVGSGEGLPLG